MRASAPRERILKERERLGWARSAHMRVSSIAAVQPKNFGDNLAPRNLNFEIRNSLIKMELGTVPHCDANGVTLWWCVATHTESQRDWFLPDSWDRVVKSFVSCFKDKHVKWHYITLEYGENGNNPHFNAIFQLHKGVGPKSMKTIPSIILNEYYRLWAGENYTLKRNQLRFEHVHNPTLGLTFPYRLCYVHKEPGHIFISQTLFSGGDQDARRELFHRTWYETYHKIHVEAVAKAKTNKPKPARMEYNYLGSKSYYGLFLEYCKAGELNIMAYDSFMHHFVAFCLHRKVVCPEIARRPRETWAWMRAHHHGDQEMLLELMLKNGKKEEL